MKDFFSKLKVQLHKIKFFLTSILNIHDLMLSDQRTKKSKSFLNEFNKFGKHYFSQSDEDGLILEIIKRLKLQKGSFLEFGVGNGLENNSLILIACGWNGAWVGGSKLAFKIDSDWHTFKYIRTWVTLKNLRKICWEAIDFLGTAPDIISMDLDGNDLVFVEEILRNEISPKVFIVEYNAKFPLPVKFSVTYDDLHYWRHDDYFGSSLASFIEVFNRHNYFLVCVNSFTGVNAFFVQNKYKDVFPDIPESDFDKWVDPSYFLDLNFLHQTSPKTIVKLIHNNEDLYSIN